MLHRENLPAGFFYLFNTTCEIYICYPRDIFTPKVVIDGLFSSSSSATSPSPSADDDYGGQVGNNHVLRGIIARWAQVTYVMSPPATPNDKSAVERVGRLPVIKTLSPFPYTLIIKRVPVDVVGKFFRCRDENEEKRGV